jgi:hypothetical protein
MAYTAKTAWELRNEQGSLLQKIADETARIAAELVLGTSSTSGAAASKSDGDTITHGLGTTPTAVFLTGSVAGEILSVTTIGATTFTIAIKTPLQAPGTAQTVYWLAVKSP